MSENLSKMIDVRIFGDFWIFFLDFRIFPVFCGFLRILISCPNFFLKKINFLFLLFLKNLF